MVCSNDSYVLLVCVPHCAIPVLQDEPGSGEMGMIGPTVSCRLRKHYVKVRDRMRVTTRF